MATLPEEKQMVRKYKNKPFALVGIDSDGGQDALQKLMKDNGVTWKMIVDQSITGPIATKWGVNAWPTFIIIDQKGVIRYKMEGDDDMTGKVDTLMAKVK
jgi:peroxiredoxin